MWFYSKDNCPGCPKGSEDGYVEGESSSFKYEAEVFEPRIKYVLGEVKGKVGSDRVCFEKDKACFDDTKFLLVTNATNMDNY